MTDPDLYFVTTNSGKLKEARHFLQITVEGITAEVDELQSTDLLAVVRHKAEQAYAQVGRPLMVEDTALVFNAWGGLPGPFVRFFIQEMGLPDMVRALEVFADHSAQALCAVGFHDGKTVHEFLGRVPGRIVKPRGTGGFGWDPIFQPEGSQRTFGEMDLDEKQGHSMRARALEQLATYLAANPASRPTESPGQD